MPDSADHVRWLTTPPTLNRPVLVTAFEGWNDAGDAASTAAQHLADRWDTSPVAEIDPESFFDFTTTRPLVEIDDDNHRSIHWPANSVRVGRVAGGERDVVVLIGLEPQLRWKTFCQQVIDIATRLGVERVISLGALLAEVPHSRPVEVYGTSENTDLQAELDLSESSYEGPTGIAGVLAASLRDAGFPGASFWAAVPSYVPGAPSPKAALALVQRVCTVVGTPVFATDLEIAAASYDRQVDELVAEDDDTAEYVSRLESAWDDAATGEEPTEDVDEGDLDDDPERLVAEVERFLRDNRD